ncbi:hypothetical protein ACL02R_28100 [Streptomyces sp. MS19]|uniref:hypothetical protein n=1 Tax=Streptomyces sp. MS19 TaxID=3385972 RepID=UPI0039A2C381
MDITVDLMVVSPGADDGEIAVVRLLSLLPAHWTWLHRATPSRIGLRITVADARPGEIRERVRAALAEDPALSAWSLTGD